MLLVYMKRCFGVWETLIHDASSQNNIYTPHYTTEFDIVALQIPSNTYAYCSQQAGKV